MTHLVYKTIRPNGHMYIGCTHLELSEREQNMKERPGAWLGGDTSDVGKLKLEALTGRRVDESTGLALEAAFVAELYGQQKWVRGGPYACLRLGNGLKQELDALVRSLKGCRSFDEKVSAVRATAKSMSSEAALVRHLKMQCFKCGGPWNHGCSCRALLFFRHIFSFFVFGFRFLKIFL